MDREAAMIMGINAERINSLSFGIGSALVGVAGAMLATHYYIYPFVGGTFGLICFCIVALGGSAASKGLSSPASWWGSSRRWAGIFLTRPTSWPSFSHISDHGLDQATRAQGMVGMRDTNRKTNGRGRRRTGVFHRLAAVSPRRSASMS